MADQATNDAVGIGESIEIVLTRYEPQVGIVFVAESAGAPGAGVGIDGPLEDAPNDAIVLRTNRGEGILSTANDVVRTRRIPHVQSQAGMGLFRTKTMPARHTAIWTLSWRSARPVIANALEAHYRENVGAVFPLLMQFDDAPEQAPFVQYLSAPAITRINGRRVSYSVELGEVPRSMVQIPT